MLAGKGDNFLSGISTERLVTLYNEEQNSKAKIRLQCAILRKKGKTQAEISDATNWPIQTISDTLRRFEFKGLEGRYAVKQKGQPPKLSRRQKIQLKKIVESSPQKQDLPFVTWTSKLVQYVIKKKFGVMYVLRQIYNLMNSFGFSIQRPRPEHLRANKELQSKFKKNSNEELRNLIKLDMRSSFWMRQSSH